MGINERKTMVANAINRTDTNTAHNDDKPGPSGYDNTVERLRSCIKRIATVDFGDSFNVVLFRCRPYI